MINPSINSLGDPLVNPLINPWLGVGMILLIFCGLLLLLRWCKERFTLKAEYLRKLMHVAMAVATLSFPWLFDTAWPVLLLAGLTIPALLGLRYIHWLRREIGCVLHDVQRNESFGELYFPLGILSLYLLARHEPLLYVIPLLTLALADASAALVGQRYGRYEYQFFGNRRSIEGSLAFFVMALLPTLALLFSAGRFGLGETFVIAGLYAWMMTLAEACSWNGLDNLLIPVVGFVLIKLLLLVPTTMIVVSIGIILVVSLFLSMHQREDSALFV